MKTSAGILLISTAPEIMFFLVHPGGPFFQKKDAGWWTIPKGEIMPSEDPLAAAIREFEEETGYRPQGPFTPLEPIVQKGGKKVFCWTCAGELDTGAIRSNTFEMEWPPKSGKIQSFAEIDKAAWFSYAAAKKMINEKQAAFIEEAVRLRITN